MDHFEILKRAFNATWRYRALWLFGILLALAGGGGGFNLFRCLDAGGGGRDNFGFPADPDVLPQISDRMLTTVVVAAVVVGLILFVVLTIARYIAQVALIGMVKEIEKTQTTSVRNGFHLGWSRSAWRLFLINLVIGIPTAILALLLFAYGLSPLLLLLVEKPAVRILGVVAAISLTLLVILILIVLSAAINLLSQFFYRQCVLEKRGVFDSIREGFWMVRRNLSNVAVMWLLMFGVGLGWSVLMIPVFMVLLVLATLIGGLPGVLIYTLTQSQATAFIVGGIVWLIVLIVPSIFLSGLYAAFTSCVWTLIYLEVQAMGEMEAEERPSPPEKAEEEERKPEPTADIAPPEAEPEAEDESSSETVSSE